MTDNTPTEADPPFERISDSCLEFKLKHTFISDNNYLFVATDNDFCRSCFQRRYFTQTMNEARTESINANIVNLARNIENTQQHSSYWQARPVQGQSPVSSFEFIPYEDCPSCGTQSTVSRDKAVSNFETLLTNETKAKLISLNQQVFSFGFANGRSTSQTSGLPNPELDQLLDNNYHARIIYRMVSTNENYSDNSCMGFDADKDLAELKALMEYLERYAFMLQLCHNQADEHDDELIKNYLERFTKTPSADELKEIHAASYWGFNLATKKVRAIPSAFIFDRHKISFIKPSSSGFGAHVDFKKSLCSSILELVERDAFVRFWHEPQRAFNFTPNNKSKADVDNILKILKKSVKNKTLVSQFFVIQSPTKLPVVMVTLSSKNITKPPALSFGFGTGFTLDEALNGAIEELRLHSSNLIKGTMVFPGFLTKKFASTIESIPERMNLYSTASPRKKLKFLDNKNPLVDGIVEDASKGTLDAIVNRFREINFDIYALDCTPECFRDKNVYVTRAFSPQLYPMQFEQEGFFNLPTGENSAHKELPHFFI